MKISTYIFRNFLILVLISNSIFCIAQKDTAVVKRVPIDTIKQKLNMDAVYNRPFLTAGKLPVAIGGYVEANTQYVGTDGVTEGFSFQMRRLTLFVSSTITKKIKILSELEFEEGTKEINLEYCAMDLEFHPLLNLRGGIIMNPIGGFNQNHDGPRWDFIDRPISATGIIPTTLSNVGMGINGKYFLHNWIFGYEFYLTNGFDDKVIDNDEGRTSLHAGKQNPDRFEESNSGLPLYTGKLAIRKRNVGEIGFSYMTGVYNKWKAEGMVIDDQRSVSVFAIDYNTSILKSKLNITGEYVNAMIDVPSTFTQQYGNKQWGAYTDVVYTLLQRKMVGWEKAKLNIGVRAEYTDYNVGSFADVNTKIGDDIWAIVPSLSFRPIGTTVIRFNFRFEGAHDLLNNPPSRTNAIQFGFSSYF
jgi:hypothetical protein